MRQQVFQLNESLHFGAVVTLRHAEASSGKYICSDGIVIRNLMTSSPTDNVIDISTCLFTILPPIKFQFEKPMQRILKEKYGQNGDEQFKEKNAISVIDQFEFQVSENKDIIEKMRRTPVKYGQSFMLQHIHSCKYLSYSRLSGNSNEYILELSQIPGQNSYFIFQACFSYQDEITNFIPFQSQLFIGMRIQSEIEIREASLNFKRGNILEEWEVSFEKKVPLKIGLYQSAEAIQPQFIYYGEPLWIFHLETSSFMKLVNNHTYSQSFFFRKIKIALNVQGIQIDEEKQRDASAIYLEKTKNQISAEKLGLWKIEAKQRFQGGKIKFDHEIRLFNIRYKVYLSVQKLQVKKKINYRISFEKYPSENTLFRMKALSANSLFVTNSDLIIFQHVLSNTYLGVNLEGTHLSTSKFFEISPNTEYKNQDNFKFTKASFMQDWQNNFVISVLPFVEEGSMMLANAQKRKIRKKEESLLHFLREALIEIMNFSQDLSECFEISDNKLGKVSFNHFIIQKILREQGFIQIVTNMLDRINPLIFHGRKSTYEEQYRVSGIGKLLLGFLSDTHFNEREVELDLFLVQSIVRIALRFLRNATKFNIESSKIMFQRLSVCIKFLGLNTGAQDFFMYFFKNNPSLLVEQATPFDAIRKQYNSLKKQQTDYFPQLFQMMTPLLIDQQSKEGNTKNQITMFEYMVRQKSPLLLPIFNMQDKLCVHYRGKSHQLEEFTRTFAQDTRIIQMTIKQIQFFSQLVYGRNYVCSRHFKDIFTFRCIMSYLKSSINSHVKASLLSLTLSCFIDERPRFHKQLPNLTYTFKDINPWNLNQSETKYEQVIELTKTKSINLQEQTIRQLLDTISLKDSLTSEQLEQMKNWMMESIDNFVRSVSIEDFYSHLSFISLLCLRKMIEFEIFTHTENQQVQKLILSIIKKLKQSMGQSQDVHEALSGNFNQILREMLEKNILKKFNKRSQFDGLEDEITMSNISLRFVKYAYYHNLFLFKKVSQQKNNVIDTVLLLIDTSSDIRIEQKMRNLILLLKQSSKINIDSSDIDTPKIINRFIKEAIIQEAIGSAPQPQSTDLLQSLTMIFYESNKYDINQKAFQQIMQILFKHHKFISALERVIIIVDEGDQEVYQNMKNNYLNLKLLVETCEIWLTDNYEDPRYIYTPVIHYFIDKLIAIMHFVIGDSPHSVKDTLLLNRYEKSLEQFGISIERQMLLANMNYAEEVMTFLKLNRVMMYKLQRKTDKNKTVFEMFQNCFNFLYLYICDCAENKAELKENFYFLLQSVQNCKAQLGQTHLFIEYLKNNYIQTLNFIDNYLESFINKILREDRYNYLFMRLLKTISKNYNEPINTSLKKLFFWLFDIGSFRKLMYIDSKTEQDKHAFQLDMNQLKYQHKDCYFYQIQAIDVLLYTSQHLEESRNTLKTNIKSSLSFQYLLNLLQLKDYFSDEEQPTPQSKLLVLFKCKILQLLEVMYMPDEHDPQFQEMLTNFLKGQTILFETFLEQFDMRKQTTLFKKVSIGSPNKQKEQQISKMVQVKLSEFIRVNTDYFQTWKKSVKKFCQAIQRCNNRTKHLEGAINTAQHLKNVINKINSRLYEVEKTDLTQDVEMPYSWHTKIKISKDDDSNRTKKFASACILETIINRDVQDAIKNVQSQLMDGLEATLKKSSINMFNFFRKISEFVEDTLEKLIEDESDAFRVRLVKDILRFLRLCLKIGDKKKQEEIRMLMGKSQIIFPFLNYLEIVKLNKSSRSILKLFIELLNELLSEEGNRTIQTVLYQYFSNKPQSFELFYKIKMIISHLGFEKVSNFKSKRISTAIQQLSKDAKRQETIEYSLLQFLILMCRGNNRKNQLFLTSLNKVSSFDVIKIVISLLRAQANDYDGIPLVNLKNYKLIMQCFQAVRALVQGPCNENQDLFVSSAFFQIALKYLKFELTSDQEVKMGINIPLSSIKYVQSIADISQQYSQKIMYMLKMEYEVSNWMVSQIKYKCIATVLSLLEENISDNAINKLVMSIPAAQIVRNINVVYDTYMQLGLKYEQKNLNIAQDIELILPLGFKMYFVLQYYAQKGIDMPKNDPAIEFFKTHTKTIEVVHSKLFTVRFPEPPTTISKAFQKEFLISTDRTSINSKLKDLQETEIQNRATDRGIWLFYLVLIINILDIAIFRIQQLPYLTGFNLYFRVFGYAQTGTLSIVELVVVLLHFVSLLLSIFLLIYEWRGAVFLINKMKSIANEPTYGFWMKTKVMLKLHYNNLDYYYYILTTLLLLFGLLNPFFDTIVLLVEFFKRNDTFAEIGRAIKESLLQLLVVLLIYFLANYILLMYLYYMYYAEYQHCSGSLARCMLFGFDYGLKSDPGIVGYNDDPSTILGVFVNRSTIQIIFDLLYLFVIKIIVQQVLGAIIVDKFAQIRQDNEKIREDEETKCYICGMDVQVFDREEDGFQKHKNEYHNIWNYFYFLIYLNNSAVRDLTGIQLFVLNCKKLGELKWFPINRSLHLENKRKLVETVTIQADEAQENIDQKIIDNQLTYLKKSIEQVSQLVNVKLFLKEMQS